MEIHEKIAKFHDYCATSNLNFKDLHLEFQENPQLLLQLGREWTQVTGKVLGLGKSKEITLENLWNGLIKIDEAIREIEGFSFLLAWWCDTGPFSIDPAPFTDLLLCAKEIKATIGKCNKREDFAPEKKENLSNWVEEYVRTREKSSYALIRIVLAAYKDVELDVLSSDVEKISPTPETMEVIQYILNGDGVDLVSMKTGKSASNVRQIRSRLKRDKYDLNS